MFLFVVYILFHKKNSKHTNYLVHVSTYITTSYYYNVQQPNFMKLGNTLSDMNDRRPLAVDFIDALGHLPSGRQAIANQARDAPVHLMDDCKGLFSLQIAMFTLQEPKRGCWSHIYGGRGKEEMSTKWFDGVVGKETAAAFLDTIM